MLWNRVVCGHAQVHQHNPSWGSAYTLRDVEQHALGTAVPLDEQSLSVSDPSVSGKSSPEKEE